jgi:chemotaxis signal transduction protein
VWSARASVWPGQNRTRIPSFVVENGANEIGPAVDRVAEVARFSATETESPPVYGLAIDTICVAAIGTSQGRIRILLDIQKVLSRD